MTLRERATSSLLITPDMTKVDALLAYRAIGWLPFMLSASKTPVRNCKPCHDEHHTPEQMEACTHLQCHGFYAATDDPDRLREMERRTPGGLIAIRTGRESGIVVIDIDTLAGHGVDGMKTALGLTNAGVLPDTAHQDSASGGSHRAYAHPGGRIKGGAHKLGRGVDVKGDGGYFVVAPSRSRKTGIPYRWVGDTVNLPLTPLHPRITAYLQEQPKPTITRRVGPLPQQRNKYVNVAVEGEVQRIIDQGATGGGRNDQLNRSAYCLGKLVGGGMLSQQDAETALYAAAEAIGLVEHTGSRQVEATIRSGLNAGTRHPRRLQGAR